MYQAHSVKLLLSSFFIFNFFIPAFSSVEFKEGTLEEIQVQAAHEGKLYFATFTAKWCAPCRLMQEYTYSDPTLGIYTDDNYLATKIDIESFDGVVYKKDHKVISLPTIIVFNSKGIEVGRFEKSLTATELLEGLQSFDTPENRIKKPMYLIPSLPDEIIARQNTKPSVGNVLPAVTETRPSETVSSPLPQGYGVQIGVFRNYSSAENEAMKFQMQFEESLNIYETSMGSNTVYRLVAGEFENRSDAGDFTGMLNIMGLDGMIKDLASLE